MTKITSWLFIIKLMNSKPKSLYYELYFNHYLSVIICLKPQRARSDKIMSKIRDLPKHAFSLMNVRTKNNKAGFYIVIFLTKPNPRD